MIVLDASAVVDALVPRQPDHDLLGRVCDEALHAPYVVDIEVVSALRRLVAAGELSADRAGDALDDYGALRLTRYPHEPLLDRIWELRNVLTPYDAAYIVLAELLDVPVVTCDARLGRAGGHAARIDVYPPTA